MSFRDNYFRLGARPLFLFGTDAYSRTYKSAAENPLTWQAELETARDLGMNLYENLQYHHSHHVVNAADWRQFRALALLTQQNGLVFMPGMLIGHNTAVGAEQLREQAALCSVSVGEFRHGCWQVLESLGPLDAAGSVLRVDADRATGLILLCTAGKAVHWRKLLNTAISRPDQLLGY